jgi:hypothetical protein
MHTRAGFDDGDLRISARQARMYVLNASGKEVPFAALQVCVCVYEVVRVFALLTATCEERQKTMFAQNSSTMQQWGSILGWRARIESLQCGLEDTQLTNKQCWPHPFIYYHALCVYGICTMHCVCTLFVPRKCTVVPDADVQLWPTLQMIADR